MAGAVGCEALGDLLLQVWFAQGKGCFRFGGGFVQWMYFQLC
jgi:hypothetical protein